MVHALEEIHRLLRPEGGLVDIHPFPEPSLVKVIQRDQILFAEPKRETDHEGVMQADRAVAEVLERKLFVAEGKADFDFFSYGSSVSELREFWDRYNAYETEPKEEAQLAYEDKAYGRAEQVLRDSSDDAEAAIHERVRIARLKPVRS